MHLGGKRIEIRHKNEEIILLKNIFIRDTTVNSANSKSQDCNLIILPKELSGVPLSTVTKGQTLQMLSIHTNGCTVPSNA